jgi:heme A synthase
VNRLWIAFAAFVILGLLTYTTISDERIRMVTFAILALFAVKTWLHRKDPRESDERDDGVK